MAAATAVWYSLWTKTIDEETLSTWTTLAFNRLAHGPWSLYDVPTVIADELYKLFDDMVNGVRTSTSDAPLSSFSAVSLSYSMHDFQLLTTADALSAVPGAA